MEEGYRSGLAIVKRIVEGHGGHIHVESRVNERTTFIIGLPVSQS